MNRLLAAILAQLPGARRDDELLDRLGSAIPAPATELDQVLAAARNRIEATPIPDLVDADTAIKTIRGAA